LLNPLAAILDAIKEDEAHRIASNVSVCAACGAVKKIDTASRSPRAAGAHLASF
jgi:hypothetical protein